MLEKTISEIEYYYKNPNIAPLHYYGASIVQIPKQLIFDALTLLKTQAQTIEQYEREREQQMWDMPPIGGFHDD